MIIVVDVVKVGTDSWKNRNMLRIKQQNSRKINLNAVLYY